VFDIFKDKVVLVAGHFGFKGGLLSVWLTHFGIKVVDASANTLNIPSNFSASLIANAIEQYHIDARDPNTIRSLIEKSRLYL
jgi:pyruvate dehydrogenase complex dehydrogenase (E1) component